MLCLVGKKVKENKLGIEFFLFYFSRKVDLDIYFIFCFIYLLR